MARNLALQLAREPVPAIRRQEITQIPGISWSEVEERLHEAIKTLAALPDRELRFLRNRVVCWPEVFREPTEIWVQALERVALNQSPYEPMREPRHIPTKDAIDRMDEALMWLVLLDKRDLEIVTSRAFKRSWVKISWRYGRSDTTVQRWYKDAITKIFGVVRK